MTPVGAAWAGNWIRVLQRVSDSGFRVLGLGFAVCPRNVQVVRNQVGMQVRGRAVLRGRQASFCGDCSARFGLCSLPALRELLTSPLRDAYEPLTSCLRVAYLQAAYQLLTSGLRAACEATCLPAPC